jgi:hypothetical protein
MLVLAVKLLFAPLFVIGTYFIQKRFGARWGGISMAVPFILVPILLVIYLQHGSDFLYNSIVGSYAGQIALLFFIATYTRMAPRFTWPICIAASTSAFLIGVAILNPLIKDLWVGIALWIIIWTISIKKFVPYDRNAKLPPAPKWDIWLRVASALFLIFTITQFAENLGPQLSGAFATYPVMTSIMSTFNHYRFGPNSSTALMHGLLQYLPATSLLILPLAALSI